MESRPMAAKHASVKLSTDFLNEARREADAFNRSVGAQVEHWARLGRLVENTPGVSVPDIRRLMDGTLKVEELPAALRPSFWTHMTAAFEDGDAEVDALYAQLGAREGAMGADE